MKEYSWWVVVGSCLVCSSAMAQPYEYRFDGQLADHFLPSFQNPNSSISQNDGSEQLEYVTPDGRLYGDNSAGLSHRRFTPGFDQSWLASIDVRLPLAYDSEFLVDNPANQNMDGDSWLEVGIAAAGNVGADELFVVTLALEPDPVNGVRRIVLATDESTGTDAERSVVDEHARLSIGYDALTHRLTAFHNGNPFLGVGLGAPESNWGLSDDGAFTLMLLGSTGHQDVSTSAPLILDNFAARIVPEPSVYTVMILALLVFARNRCRVGDPDLIRAVKSAGGFRC